MSVARIDEIGWSCLYTIVLQRTEGTSLVFNITNEPTSLLWTVLKVLVGKRYTRSCIQAVEIVSGVLSPIWVCKIEFKFLYTVLKRIDYPLRVCSENAETRFEYRSRSTCPSASFCVCWIMWIALNWFKIGPVACFVLFVLGLWNLLARNDLVGIW